MPCNKLKDLLNEEIAIIKRHLDEHAYFQGIEDKEKATRDFIDKYAFIMRESYCDLCPETKTCQDYKDYLESKGWNRYWK
jgi:hypothetical protein